MPGPKEALAACDAALAAGARTPALHGQRGILLRALGRPREAVEAFDRGWALNPAYAQAFAAGGLDALPEEGKRLLWNKSLALLTLGDLPGGLPLYEARGWTGPGDPQARTEPLWTGIEDVAGKIVFLHGEQGLGDTIQFCRYAKLLRERGARVVLAAQTPLVELLKSLDPAVTVIDWAYAPTVIDYRARLMSLPLAFGSTVETIPAPDRYLAADPALAARWARRLGPKTRPRIGLAWGANADNPTTALRAVPPERLTPLLGVDADWFSLAPEAAAPWAGVTAFGPELDFPNTAALIEQLDLVISVDTSLAHLAGALGKPVWILLPFAADWRWFDGRGDSPWYPGARLFRQTRPGDWDGVVERVKAALAAP